MKAKIQIVIENENFDAIIADVVSFQRNGDLTAATLGLTLQEAKEVTSNIQRVMTTHQLKKFLNSKQVCSCCNKKRTIKDYCNITYRTLFGKLKLKSPRLNQCSCKKGQTKTFSPLADLLPERISPELSYLQAKWVSLVSYNMTTDMLNEVLPIDISNSSVRTNAQEVANRLESELGDEQVFFATGCQNDWDKLPKPGTPLTVGIDGGYVHAREGKNRKAGWFEIIVGKSLQENKETKRFGFVATYDQKPKRRLYEMLKSQGLQMNQNVIFISDGGEDVRDLQLYMSPQAEHVLDWFHISMRLQVMEQIATGLKTKETPTIKERLESTKWHLWHGNTYKALQYLEALTEDLYFDIEDPTEKQRDKKTKLYKLADEFYNYIRSNEKHVINYSDRYNYGEYISSGFVESTVNELVSNRMVKKQQMRWTKKGAHLLLQLRVKTLNNELRDTFCRWYPGMKSANEDAMIKVA